jgi:2-polyprenyl-3-methyl-5-hydroxy-6-metoxy-1,4-benzoquinol methylase
MQRVEHMASMHPPCPVCLSVSDARPETDKTWLSGFQGLGHLVRCVECSLVYLRDYTSEVVDFHGDEYVRARVIQSCHEPSRDREQLFTERLAWAATQTKGRRVLDIGCGNGAFLLAARASGWTPFGLDNSEVPRELLLPQGLDVCVADAVEFLKEHPAAFDLIHMNHSLEHIPNAADTVLAAKKALAPGGLLYVEVPNEFDNLVYRSMEVLGRKRMKGSFLGHSKPAQVPSPHLYFFNKKSLARLASRAGFDTFNVHARRREPFELTAAEVACSLAALLGAGFLLTLTARVAALKAP